MGESVMLVEDDARLAEMVESYLEGHGIDVTVVGTCAEAIDLHGHHGFEAIILDLMLPDIDGLEVCRKIKSRNCALIAVVDGLKGFPEAINCKS